MIDLASPLEKRWPIRRPFTVEAPRRWLDAEMLEIRVSITPLRYVDAVEGRRTEQSGEAIYSQYQLVTIEAKDSRALFHVARQLLLNLFREYLGVDL